VSVSDREPSRLTVRSGTPSTALACAVRSVRGHCLLMLGAASAVIVHLDSVGERRAEGVARERRSIRDGHHPPR
jgi:hypothetical protein